MADKFLGAPYPIIRSPRGLLATQSGVDQIKSDLLALLLTNPGERVMLPTYGTPLRTLFFDPNDVFTEQRARDMIVAAITTWEPRITVEHIEIIRNIDEKDLNPDDSREDIEQIMLIKILFFDPENIKEVQELRLEVPLSGGNDG